MTDRALELERRLMREKTARYRARKAGLLAPLERCTCGCGRRVQNDRWGGLAATCARVLGVDRRGSTKEHPRARERGTPRAVRVAAEAVLRELWAEGKASQRSAQRLGSPGAAADLLTAA